MVAKISNGPGGVHNRVTKGSLGGTAEGFAAVAPAGESVPAGYASRVFGTAPNSDKIDFTKPVGPEGTYQGSPDEEWADPDAELRGGNSFTWVLTEAEKAALGPATLGSGELPSAPGPGIRGYWVDGPTSPGLKPTPSKVREFDIGGWVRTQGRITPVLDSQGVAQPVDPYNAPIYGPYDDPGYVYMWFTGPAASATTTSATFPLVVGGVGGFNNPVATGDSITLPVVIEISTPTPAGADRQLHRFKGYYGNKDKTAPPRYISQLGYVGVGWSPWFMANLDRIAVPSRQSWPYTGLTMFHPDNNGWYSPFDITITVDRGYGTAGYWVTAQRYITALGQAPSSVPESELIRGIPAPSPSLVRGTDGSMVNGGERPSHPMYGGLAGAASDYGPAFATRALPAAPANMRSPTTRYMRICVRLQKAALRLGVESDLLARDATTCDVRFVCTPAPVGASGSIPCVLATAQKGAITEATTSGLVIVPDGGHTTGRLRFSSKFTLGQWTRNPESGEISVLLVSDTVARAGVADNAVGVALSSAAYSVEVREMRDELSTWPTVTTSSTVIFGGVFWEETDYDLATEDNYTSTNRVTNGANGTNGVRTVGGTYSGSGASVAALSTDRTVLDLDHISQSYDADVIPVMYQYPPSGDGQYHEYTVVRDGMYMPSYSYINSGYRETRSTTTRVRYMVVRNAGVASIIEVGRHTPGGAVTPAASPITLTYTAALGWRDKDGYVPAAVFTYGSTFSGGMSTVEDAAGASSTSHAVTLSYPVVYPEPIHGTPLVCVGGTYFDKEEVKFYPAGGVWAGTELVYGHVPSMPAAEIIIWPAGAGTWPAQPTAGRYPGIGYYAVNALGSVANTSVSLVEVSGEGAINRDTGDPVSFVSKVPDPQVQLAGALDKRIVLQEAEETTPPKTATALRLWATNVQHKVRARTWLKANYVTGISTALRNCRIEYTGYPNMQWSPWTGNEGSIVTFYVPNNPLPPELSYDINTPYLPFGGSWGYVESITRSLGVYVLLDLRAGKLGKYALAKVHPARSTYVMFALEADRVGLSRLTASSFGSNAVASAGRAGLVIPPTSPLTSTSYVDYWRVAETDDAPAGPWQGYASFDSFQQIEGYGLFGVFDDPYGGTFVLRVMPDDNAVSARIEVYVYDDSTGEEGAKPISLPVRTLAADSVAAEWYKVLLSLREPLDYQIQDLQDDINANFTPTYLFNISLASTWFLPYSTRPVHDLSSMQTEMTHLVNLRSKLNAAIAAIEAFVNALGGDPETREARVAEKVADAVNKIRETFAIAEGRMDATLVVQKDDITTSTDAKTGLWRTVGMGGLGVIAKFSNKPAKDKPTYFG